MYDFPYHFSGIVGAMSYGMSVHIVYRHRAISCMGIWSQARQSHTETVQRLYVNCAILGKSQYSLCRFHIEIIHRWCGLNTAAMQRWCGDCATGVRSPYDIVCRNDHLKILLFP